MRSTLVVCLSACLSLAGCTDDMMDMDQGVPVDLNVDHVPDLVVADFAHHDFFHGDLLPVKGDLAGCEGTHFCPNPLSCPCIEPVEGTACGDAGAACFYE